MRRVLVVTAVALLALAGAARASDPVGIYALIDKVVTEPGRGDAERVRIFGVFRLAREKPGDTYEPAAYGYLYYTLAPGKAADSRREWADMKALEGTGQVIAFGARAFGQREQALGKVREVAEKPEKPTSYPIADGLHKVREDNGIAEGLRSFVIPKRPVDGGVADAREATLSAKPIADKERRGVKYVFEISDGAGNKETSAAREPGKDAVDWAPKMRLKPGEKYTWRVWAVSGDWKGPVTVATFKGM